MSYTAAVEDLRKQYAALPAGAPVRLGKRTSNLFRGRGAVGPGLDVSGLTGVMNGFGIFQNDDKDVLVGLWDIPGIADFRTHLIERVKDHGASLREEDHGFTPHMTLGYDDGEFIEVPRVPASVRGKECRFDSVWLVWGEEWTEVTLS